MKGWLQVNATRLFLAIALIWFVGVLAQGFLVAHDLTIFSADFALSGTFGDSFGGLSALMASLAALGAWQAVSYQRQELLGAIDREKLLDQTAAKRDFEATFYRLLATLQQVEEGVKVTKRFVKSTGKDAFTIMLTEFNKYIDSGKDDLQSYYSSFYENYRDNLAHYFRLLFNIIKFAESDRKENCYFYIKLIRATLSESELVMIGLNGMYHPEGVEALYPLINKYSLLDNVSESAKVYYSFKGFYDEVAFNSKLRGPKIVENSNAG